MKSMTGYAKRQIAVGDKKISIEIKTLNSKQLDLIVKLPSCLREKELDIRSMLGALERGKIEAVLTLENSDSAAATLNTNLASMRLDEVAQLAAATGYPMKQEDVFTAIVSQTAVWENASSEELSESESEQLMSGVREAIQETDKFRSDEGMVLRKDFDKHVAEIEQRLERIPQYESERIETAKERIRRYFSEFALAEMDKDRFEQELIYYLEKLDITEEKVRLRKHIDFFRKTMDEEPICGKKLGFIAQEMGREINTTGSKANHVEIQRLVVEMKDELEKIKEQLGNIL